jgi:hypothetical protein
MAQTRPSPENIIYVLSAVVFSKVFRPFSPISFITQLNWSFYNKSRIKQHSAITITLFFDVIVKTFAACVLRLLVLTRLFFAYTVKDEFFICFLLPL